MSKLKINQLELHYDYMFAAMKCRVVSIIIVPYTWLAFDETRIDYLHVDYTRVYFKEFGYRHVQVHKSYFIQK